MFGKKQQQQVIEEFSDEQSQPLIEEVDPNYNPTQREVKEYAIDTLGMKLPEDQNLLYLAREGLKAPIPQNWVPYQDRNGEVYYKHMITQEKIYEHPTDIQYRKKYQQQKQKMARNNLKSLALKQSNPGLLPNGGLLQNGGLLPNGERSGLSNKFPSAGISKISNIIEQTENTIDEALLAEYEQQMEQFQKRQQKQWREYSQEMEEEHAKRLRKLKEEYEEQLKMLKNPSQFQAKTGQALLEQQKQKLYNSLQQSQEMSLQQQLRLIEKQQQVKLEEYRAIYEEDHKIKLKKTEQELLEAYNEKQRKLQQKIRKAQQKNVQFAQQRYRMLQQFRRELERPDNPQIEQLLQQTVKNNIESIRQEYNLKLAAKQQELEAQLHEMRKILGVDKSHQLIQFANKKEKLKSISDMKIAAFKNKELQVMQSQFEQDLENRIRELERKLEKEEESKLESRSKELEQRMSQAKLNADKVYAQRTAKAIENLYQEIVSEKSQYELNMNKRMSELRMKYIDDISHKNCGNSADDLANRMLIEQKSSQLRNKEELVKTMERQLELEQRELSIYQFDWEISYNFEKGEESVTDFLKQKMQKLGIQYRSQQYVKWQQNYQKLKSKYKDDKKLLTQILRSLQETNYQFQSMNAGTGALIRKYNEDVRKMRQNQEMLNKCEILLKKAEIDGDSAELATFFKQSEYREISLKNDLNLGKQFEHRLECVDEGSNEMKGNEMKSNEMKRTHKLYAPYSGNTIDSVLREHSKFLTTVKNQLNRKLYQVRYDRH